MMVEFFFDCSSPWTYLGFDSMERLQDQTGVEVDWRPILVGGVFNAINESVYEQRSNPVPAKLAYARKDLQDWARRQGLTIGHPTIFPVNSARAMRACIAAGLSGQLPIFARAVFDAYWNRDEDISQPAVLAAIADRVKLDAHDLLSRADSEAIRTMLRSNTSELIDRGGFGSPTIFLGDDMYFGNDRMVLVRDAIGRRPA
ncbi:MAG: 2-hydroxychromene-2-carboxylate isomerase [Sphingobium sp.]